MDNREQNQTLNQTPVQPVEETAPVAPVVASQPEAPVEPAQLPVDACNNCLGEGLLGDPQGVNSVCPSCGGTGVIK